MSTVTVRLPGVLDVVTDGQRTVQVEGDTVAEALEALCSAHPALRPRLFDDSGGWRRHVLCVLASEPINPADDIPLQDGAELTIMPAVSGG